MFAAGTLDTLITIQSRTVSQNQIGEAVDTWADTAHTYAHKSSRSGREFYSASRTVAEDAVFFTIRHMDGLDSTMRVLHGSDAYDITAIRYSEKRRESIELQCRKVT
ncbi:phage head closure protein [Paludibaculum fermentans]|uniref:phage head closure protein n=1 Tax=Paludibaculum fermentans TaxID=1473598 RepID=UPI003EBDD5FA